MNQTLEQGTEAHVLIVEDSDTQAARLRLYLEANGWTVSRASTGREARQMLFDPASAAKTNGVNGKDGAQVMNGNPDATVPHSNPYDLVLLDYHLPDTLGDILCREIRLQESERLQDQPRQMPVLMFTSSERQDTELQTLQSGADDFVPKSVSIEVVLARLNALLQKARMRSELHSRYERERRVAQVLQESLLSTPPADAFPGLTFEMVYESAWDEARIGGDFYDIRAMGDGRVALVVGDVTGKGLEAATFTAEVKYALRAFLHEHPEPGRALEQLNDFLSDGVERNPWMSSACVAVAVALCDTKTGEIKIATAGSEPPMLVHRKEGAVVATELIGKHGPLLGIRSGTAYHTNSYFMDSQDVLLLFTDGVTEARRRGGDILGYERVMEIAQENYALSDKPTETLVSAIMAESRRISGNQLLDDICLLAVQRS